MLEQKENKLMKTMKNKLTIIGMKKIMAIKEKFSDQENQKTSVKINKLLITTLF